MLLFIQNATTPSGHPRGKLSQKISQEDLDEFVSVIEDLVVCRKEVYTMSQLWNLYCKIGDHTNVRAI